jgi:hypothetical protein
MSIEIMYPSRRQSRSHNPLFARAQRRQKLALMLVMAALGLGLLLLQLVPVTAHADDAAVQAKPATETAAPSKPEAPRRTVRQIKIYETVSGAQ